MKIARYNPINPASVGMKRRLNLLCATNSNSISGRRQSKLSMLDNESGPSAAGRWAKSELLGKRPRSARANPRRRCPCRHRARGSGVEQCPAETGLEETLYQSGFAQPPRTCFANSRPHPQITRISLILGSATRGVANAVNIPEPWRGRIEEVS